MHWRHPLCTAPFGQRNRPKKTLHRRFNSSHSQGDLWIRMRLSSDESRLTVLVCHEWEFECRLQPFKDRVARTWRSASIGCWADGDGSEDRR